MIVKTTRRLMILLMIIAMLLPTLAAQADPEGVQTSYTYNYDYWSDIRESPDAYRVLSVINNTSLGLETPMRKPKGLYIRGNDIYVCDTGNNRLLQIARTESGYHLTRIIDKLNGCTPETLNTPTDCFVDEAGTIYICDSANGRVVVVDKDLNYIKAFTKPDDATFSADVGFTPYKLVVDVAGRAYVLASNVNKGLIKYEADTTFGGFMGANKVTYNMAEYLWKTFFTTEAQRSQQEAFVPTEYENI